MRYALLIYAAPESRDATQTEADEQPRPMETDAGVIDNWVAYTRALKDAGALVAIQRLQLADTATSVHMRDGERLLTDGPFIETKEQLLGFFLIEAPSLDVALDWAARMPHARPNTVTVEVRPIMPAPELTRIVEE